MTEWFMTSNWALALMALASQVLWWVTIGFVILEWNVFLWEPYQRALWVAWPIILLVAIGSAVAADD